VILSQLHAIGKLAWNDYVRERDAERERAMTAIADRETSGGNYYTTVPHMISPTLLRAVVASTQNGTTPYTEAMGLLSASLKSVEGLIERVGAG
jgi:hypothetical protein